MTTLASLDFEALTEGQTVGNGSGVFGTNWTVNATTTATGLAAAATAGSRGLRLASTGTGFWQGIWTDPGGTTTSQRVLGFDFIVRSFTAVPFLGTILDGAGTNKGQWRVNSNGTVAIRNNTSAVATSVPTLSVNTTYHAEWMTNTGAATQELRIYVGAGVTTGTPFITLTGSISAATSQNGFYFGFGAAANGSGVDFDAVAVRDDWPLTSVTSTRATTWNTLAAVTATRSTTWNVAGVLTSVTSTRATTWHTRALVTSTRSTTWRVLAAVDPNTVMVLGDSLTYMGGTGVTYITNALAAHGWDSSKIFVSGVTGRLIWGGSTHPDCSETIDDWRANGHDGRIWIVGLGANNQGATHSALLGYYDSLLQYIGPGRVVHFIDQGFEGQSENTWSFTSGNPVGSKYTATGLSQVNAAIRNQADIANADPSTYPSCVVHDWNGYAPMRAAGTSIWNDPADTSSIGGTARHMVDAGYLNYRAPFYALAIDSELGHVVSTRATTWNTRAAVSPSTRATTWNTLAAVTATRSTTWHTRASTTSTRSTSWNVSTAVTATRATSWHTLAGVTPSARSTTWNVLAALTSTRSTTWNTRSSAISTRATSWNVLAAAASPRATTWNVLTAAASTRSTTWHVRAAVTSARSTSWNVAGTLASVSSTRSTTWRVATSVSSSRATSWTVTTPVSSQRNTLWDVKTAVAAARSTSWNVRGPVTSQRNALWHVRQAVSSSRSTSWNVADPGAAPGRDITILGVRDATRRTTVRDRSDRVLVTDRSKT